MGNASKLRLSPSEPAGRRTAIVGAAGFALSAAVLGACGKSNGGCDPLQTAGMTRAELESQVAAQIPSADAPKPPHREGPPKRREDARCADLDVVRVTNGHVTDAWFLRGDAVIGFTHKTDSGPGTCSGDVPVACR